MTFVSIPVTYMIDARVRKWTNAIQTPSTWQCEVSYRMVLVPPWKSVALSLVCCWNACYFPGYSMMLSRSLCVHENLNEGHFSHCPKSHQGDLRHWENARQAFSDWPTPMQHSEYDPWKLVAKDLCPITYILIRHRSRSTPSVLYTYYHITHLIPIDWIVPESRPCYAIYCMLQVIFCKWSVIVCLNTFALKIRK